MSLRLSVPGKAFVAGEYAVLAPGEPALVLAVDRRLHAVLEARAGRPIVLRHGPSGAEVALEADALGRLHATGGVPAELRFARAGVELALRCLTALGTSPRGFSLRFEDAFSGAVGVKLGLGGSAAATVLAVQAALVAHEHRPPREAVLALAAAAHWAEQGGAGSGGDVAASALGGLLEVRARPVFRDAAEALAAPAAAHLASPLVAADSVALPPDLHFLLAATEVPADSRALQATVRDFAAASPGRYRHHVFALSDCARSLRAALEEAARTVPDSPEGGRAREAALQAVRRGAVAMAALGAEAGAPIATDALQRACALAAAAGVAGKPSGAGGGDCAIVLAFGDAAAARAERTLAAAFHTLRVVPAEGLLWPP